MVERKHPKSHVASTGNDDGGFTLIELMVVVLVIAILLAVAIPTFLGARVRSQDRSAQSNLRNSLTAAKVLFVDHGTYDGAESTNLSAIEPGLTFHTSGTPSDDDDEISVQVSGTRDAIWAAAAESDSGTCWLIKDDSATSGAPRGTLYGKTTASCVATAATALNSATARTFPP